MTKFYREVKNISIGKPSDSEVRDAMTQYLPVAKKQKQLFWNSYNKS